MAKVLVVTSGKGWRRQDDPRPPALGAALAQRGDKVVVVDFDVGLRKPRSRDGRRTPRRVRPSSTVVQGVAKLPQALIKDKRAGEFVAAAGLADPATRTRWTEEGRSARSSMICAAVSTG